MAFTKAHAKILLGMLTPEQLAAFKFICGKGEDNSALPETIDELVSLELIRLERVDEGRMLALLTPRGKKVALEAQNG